MARPDEHLADVVDPSVKRHEDLRRGKEAQGSQLGSQQRRSRNGPQGLALSQGAGGEGGEVCQGARMRQEQYQGQSNQAEFCDSYGQHGQARAMSPKSHRSGTPPCLLHSREMLMTLFLAGFGRAISQVAVGRHSSPGKGPE